MRQLRERNLRALLEYLRESHESGRSSSSSLLFSTLLFSTYKLLSEEHARLQPDAAERLGLSRREAEILAWVCRGKTNAEIGNILSISARTVQKHLEHVFDKLGVETRTAAAAIAIRAMRRGED